MQHVVLESYQFSLLKRGKKSDQLLHWYSCICSFPKSCYQVEYISAYRRMKATKREITKNSQKKRKGGRTRGEREGDEKRCNVWSRNPTNFWVHIYWIHPNCGTLALTRNMKQPTRSKLWLHVWKQSPPRSLLLRCRQGASLSREYVYCCPNSNNNWEIWFASKQETGLTFNL